MLRSFCSKVLVSACRSRQICTSSKQLFIYKNLENVRKDGMVKVRPTEAYESRRYLLRRHGMGFSFHETVVYKGKKQFFNYANHLEAVMVTYGTGWVEIVNEKDDLGKGRRFPLKPGAMYAIDNHEKHWVGADPEINLHCVTVFTPPIQGTEQMNEEGVIPVVDDDGNIDYHYWESREETGQPIRIKLAPKTFRDAHYYDLVRESVHSS